jgi:hypothetical protein
MDATRRRELARRALDGYVSGPTAAIDATATALTKVADARAIVLVEGISDEIAVEAAALGVGRDLEAEQIVILPTGGAHAVGRVLTRLGSLRSLVRVAGLCDSREAKLFERRLNLGIDGLRTESDLDYVGCFVCVDDLEDELIRAVGPAAVEALFDTQGDLAAFRSLQSQPAWRGRPIGSQLRRFLGSGSTRKLRYARLLTGAAVDRGVLPAPVDALLTSV